MSTAISGRIAGDVCAPSRSRLTNLSRVAAAGAKADDGGIDTLERLRLRVSLLNVITSGPDTRSGNSIEAVV